MDEFSDALMQWAWRFMGLIYGEFPETAARLILSAALRKLRQLAKRLFRSVFPSRGRHARHRPLQALNQHYRPAQPRFSDDSDQ